MADFSPNSRKRGFSAESKKVQHFLANPGRLCRPVDGVAGTDLFPLTPEARQSLVPLADEGPKPPPDCPPLGIGRRCHIEGAILSCLCLLSMCNGVWFSEIAAFFLAPADGKLTRNGSTIALNAVQQNDLAETPRRHNPGCRNPGRACEDPRADDRNNIARSRSSRASSSSRRCSSRS
jgi:hypothetical protein